MTTRSDLPTALNPFLSTLDFDLNYRASNATIALNYGVSCLRVAVKNNISRDTRKR